MTRGARTPRAATRALRVAVGLLVGVVAVAATIEGGSEGSERFCARVPRAKSIGGDAGAAGRARGSAVSRPSAGDARVSSDAALAGLVVRFGPANGLRPEARLEWTHVASGAHGREVSKLGAFRLAGLRPGAYRLELGEHELLDGWSRPSSSWAVELTSGRVEEVTLGLIPPASVIGHVLDARGVPIADADVLLRAGQHTPVVARATTDAEGTFRLTALRPGTFHIVAPQTTALRGRGGLIAPQRLSLVPGERRWCELRLAPDACSVSGRVVDGEARGVGHLRLVCQDPATGATFARARTDDEGRFRFTQLPALPLVLRTDPRERATRADGAPPRLSAPAPAREIRPRSDQELRLEPLIVAPSQATP